MDNHTMFVSHCQDVLTGECYQLDHLIKHYFEKMMADKKTSTAEKEALSRTLARLDGMTMVCIYLVVVYRREVISWYPISISIIQFLLKCVCVCCIFLIMTTLSQEQH